MRAFTLLFLLLLLLISTPVRAETLQAPIGGKALPLGTARVGCSQPGGGWFLDSTGHFVRPPAAMDAVGKAVELRIAPDASRCAKSSMTLTLLATGRWPVIDPASVQLFVDEGRAEARGRNLRGVALVWRSRTASGLDVCETPKLEANAERCSWQVGPGMPANPDSGALSWLPRGGKAGEDVVSFGADGKAAPEELFVLPPARVSINHLLPPDSAIDLSSGRGEVPLAHPDAMTSANCGSVRCEISQGKLLVKGLSNVLKFVDVTFGLAPRVSLDREGARDVQATAHLAVLHCPMSVISGPPLRGVDSAQTVVRIEGGCAKDLQALRFQVEGRVLEVTRTQVDEGGADVMLKLGRFDDSTLSIVAMRREDQTNAVAVARIDTAPAPDVHSALELPGYPNIDFIPSNRFAVVHVPKLQNGAYLVPLPIEGVYEAKQAGTSMLVQSDRNAAGLTALRFGYRSSALRGALRDENLAVLTDPLQRSIHEANVPAPIDVSAFSARPLVEFVCTVEGRTVRIKPGETAQIPFTARDNCRVVFHRERLRAEYGTQKLSLDIEVLSLDNVSRGESHVSQTVVLRPGPTPRLAWVRGVKNPFDRVIVRLSHAADEAHYIGALEIPTGAPAIQWTLVLGSGRLRLYATTAIPTGLYRFGDSEHSGVLSLNFGIVSRLTWLTSDGHEGLLGLEAGVMAFGLTNSKSTTGQNLTQVGLITGLGLSVPIANRSSATEASINLHGWLEMDATRDSDAKRDQRFALIFGPSISIGNVGTNL